jgi:trk system potassium uptake protein TrkA
LRVIIIGAGKVGYKLAEKLSEENHQVLIIEQQEERRKILQENLDVLVSGGNGASPRVLADAGVTKTDLLVAVTDQDEVNMLACMVAKRAGVARTVARVRSPEYVQGDQALFREWMGIDLLINPEMVTAMEILQILKTPAALDVEEFSEGKVRLLEVKLRTESPFANITLKNLNLPPDILVIGILRQEKMIIPKGHDILMPNDHVFFIGEHDAIIRFEDHFSNKRSKVERVMIVGAGRVGRHLAVLLEKSGISVKIIDNNPDRCDTTVCLLDQGIVLHGDGTDIDLLKQEGVGEADAVVCLTNDDKLNLLVALLAKRLGAKKTFVRVGRNEYASIMQQVGVDIVLSPQILTAGVILRFIRQGDLVSLMLFEGAKAEAMELVVAEGAKIIGKPLFKCNFPAEALIGTVVRNGKAMIANGNTVIQAGDHAVVFTLPGKADEIARFFQGQGS